MMAGGGGANVDRAILSGLGQATSVADVQAMNNEPMMQDRSIENQIFTLQSQITNLMNDYNIAVNDQDFNTAQAIANQINNLDVAISQMQAQMPMGLGEKKN